MGFNDLRTPYYRNHSYPFGRPLKINNFSLRCNQKVIQTRCSQWSKKHPRIYNIRLHFYIHVQGVPKRHGQLWLLIYLEPQIIQWYTLVYMVQKLIKCASPIYFNVSSVCRAKNNLYTSSCHIRLNMFVSTSAHAAAIRKRTSCRFAILVLSTTTLTNLHRKKIKGGYVWWSWGPGGWSVSANLATWKFFHSG